MANIDFTGTLPDLTSSPVVSAVLAEGLPNKADADMVSLPVSSVRSLLADAVSRAEALHREQAHADMLRIAGPLLGCGTALEAICDTAESLVQINGTDNGISMVIELIKAVQSRLEAATDELERARRAA